MARIISKQAKRCFRILTPEADNFQLILDFNPLIEKFKLTGEFKLIHWQAKPKGYREWGIYDSKDDSYKSLEKFDLTGKFTTLQIPDSEVKSVPSAVLLYRD